MAAVREAFTHQATPANTFGDTTIIDHKETNNKPNAIRLITDIAIPGPGGTIPGHREVIAAAYITLISLEYRPRYVKGGLSGT